MSISDFIRCDCCGKLFIGFVMCRSCKKAWSEIVVFDEEPSDSETVMKAQGSNLEKVPEAKNETEK